MSDDDQTQDERIAEIRVSHFGCQGQWSCDATVLLATIDVQAARLAALEAMVNRCADWFGVPLQEYALRWGGGLVHGNG